MASCLEKTKTAFDQIWELREELLSLMPSVEREKLFEAVVNGFKKKSLERGDAIDQVIRLYVQKNAWDVYFLMLYSQLKKLKNEAFNQNLGLVWKTLVDLKVIQEQREDAFQQGAMGLYKAVELYDPRKGAKFGSVAYSWIKAYVTSFMGKEKVYYHKTLSYDVPITEDSDEAFIDLMSSQLFHF